MLLQAMADLPESKREDTDTDKVFFRSVSGLARQVLGNAAFKSDELFQQQQHKAAVEEQRKGLKRPATDWPSWQKLTSGLAASCINKRKCSDDVICSVRREYKVCTWAAVAAKYRRKDGSQLMVADVQNHWRKPDGTPGLATVQELKQQLAAVPDDQLWSEQRDYAEDVLRKIWEYKARTQYGARKLAQVAEQEGFVYKSNHPQAGQPLPFATFRNICHVPALPLEVRKAQILEKPEPEWWQKIKARCNIPVPVSPC